MAQGAPPRPFYSPTDTGSKYLDGANSKKTSRLADEIKKSWTLVSCSWTVKRSRGRPFAPLGALAFYLPRGVPDRHPHQPDCVGRGLFQDPLTHASIIEGQSERGKQSG